MTSPSSTCSSTCSFQAHHTLVCHCEDMRISGSSQSRIMPDNVAEDLSFDRLTISDNEDLERLRSAANGKTAITATHRELYERELQIKENKSTDNAEQAQSAGPGHNRSQAQILATKVDASHARMPQNGPGYVQPPAQFKKSPAQMIVWRHSCWRGALPDTGLDVSHDQSPRNEQHPDAKLLHRMSEFHMKILEECKLQTLSLIGQYEDLDEQVEPDIDNMNIDELEAAWIAAMKRDL
ncbi:hypothetical protein M7I_0402 [Glarea lozoyensis 74030]|nr:hypothetical protein M7I_0402 [Glarea lozoyensis 74030]